jgi:5'-nucleotidase / UDP-sugar diphosphatase
MKLDKHIIFYLTLGVLCLFSLTACAPISREAIRAASSTPSEDAAIVHMTLLQMNDVYEITPVSGGKQGGLARVSTIRQQLLAENPNTYTVLAGDLFNPSALGTAKVDGQRLNGKQIVDVMNVLGLDFATFGNHEFDLNEPTFAQRLQESKTTWFSSNVMLASGQPITNVASSVIFTVTNPAGTAVRVGMFGLTLPSNPVAYVKYLDVKESAAQQVAQLKDQVDVLIAVTHLPWEDDRDLAVSFPEIDLIMGGHEHENIQTWRGADLTPIAKADANARSVYIHDLYYNTATGALEIDSRLRRVTDAIPDEPAVAAAVQQWLDVAFAGFRQLGFEPDNVVTTITEPLDGTEASVRFQPTRLTDLIAQSMVHAVAGAELAMFNGGSIRIDDTLPPGPITEYDVIRILPFGGKVMDVEMTGSLLQEVLDAGEANQGLGGYLQTANVVFDPSTSNWNINGAALDPEQSYRVAINDFLISGRERGIEFLNRDNPGLKVHETGAEPDVRQTLIDELQAFYGAP